MIHRDEHAENFTILSNDFIRDSKLSDSAFRLLVFMLSMSNEWAFNVSVIASQLNYPKRKVMRLLAELKEAGHVEIKKIHDNDGHFGAYKWEIHENPIHRDTHFTELGETPNSVNDGTRQKTELGESPHSANTELGETPNSVKSVPIRRTNITKEDQLVKEISNIKEKRGNFVPPSVEEVASYCFERHNSVDPESFVNFYASKGWMVGKNKMKDWKAAVITWEKREKSTAIPKKTTGGNVFLERLRGEA